MDRSNYSNIRRLDKKDEFGNKIKMMTDFVKYINVTEVPDPYYDGPKEFHFVIDLLEDGSNNLLKYVTERL
jgi:protein-tyrosine phosphatase